MGEEKRHNLRLTKPKPEFVELMANLGLPYPKKIGEPPPLPAVCVRCKACHSCLCVTKKIVPITPVVTLLCALTCRRGCAGKSRLWNALWMMLKPLTGRQLQSCTISFDHEK